MSRWRGTRRQALSMFAVTPFAIHLRQAGEQLCGKCKTTGYILNPKWADRKEYEDGAEICSVVVDEDPTGAGYELIPCPSCLATSKVAAANKEHSGKLAKLKDWRDKFREIDRLAGSKAIHCETKRFYLTFDLPQIKVNKVIYDRHRAMHLYAKRAEDLFTEIQDFHGISDAEIGGKVKHHVAMFEKQSCAKALAPHTTHLELQGAAKVHKIGPAVSATVAWDDPRFVKTGGDESRHQFFIHLIVHHIYHDMKCYEWWLYDQHGWLFDGTAHYWEYRKIGTPFVNCAQEQAGGPIDMSHTFESSVRKLVNANQVRPLANVVERNCATLTLVEKQFAWSYIDFLCWWDAKAFKNLLFACLKRDTKTRDAIKDAYGMSVPQVQEQWEVFVKANYQLKERKGPLVHAPRKVS